MKKLLIPATAAMLCFFSLSCAKLTTDPGASITFSARSSKCLTHNTPGVNGLDSLFLYSFPDSLVLDFSVKANCCPDSNRFSISQTTGSDTIVVTVTDTAENGCRCVCPYMIHTSFESLPYDRYVVRCRLCASGDCDDPIYLVEVVRSR